MSNNQKKKTEAVAQVLFSGVQKPLVDATEKRPKTGNGKATFKTASAAANAAREARDEAKEAAERCFKTSNYCTQAVREINAIMARGLESDSAVIAAMDRACRSLVIWCGLSIASAAGFIATLIFS